MTCFFQGGFGECSGRLDPHHLIAKNRLKREFRWGALRLRGTEDHFNPADRYVTVEAFDTYDYRPLIDILTDRRNLVPCCRHHHSNLHAAAFSFPFEDLPEEAIAFAEQYGLLSALERAYPRKVAA